MNVTHYTKVAVILVNWTFTSHYIYNLFCSEITECSKSPFNFASAVHYALLHIALNHHKGFLYKTMVTMTVLKEKN